MKGSAYTKVLQESDIDSWKSIGKCIERNKQSNENFIESFLNDPSKKAFIGPEIFIKPHVKKYFVSEAPFFNVMGGIPTSKKFSCLKYLNDVMLRLSAAGITQKIKNDENFMHELKKLPPDPNESGMPKALGYQDFKGAFLILIFDYIVAFTVLLIEITTYRYFGDKK